MIANTYRQSSFPDLKIRQIASVEPRVSWDRQSTFFECLRENCESARIWRCVAVEGSKGERRWRGTSLRDHKDGGSGANGLLLIAAGCSLITSIWKVTTLQECLRWAE